MIGWTGIVESYDVSLGLSFIRKEKTARKRMGFIYTI